MELKKTLQNIVLAGTLLTAGIVGLTGCGEKKESRYTGYYIALDVDGNGTEDYDVAVCVPREGTDGTASMMISRREEDPRAPVVYHEADYVDIDSLRNQMEEQ
ncbi:MAG: hypothetical protein ABIJ20_04355 [Nanoarchaeota archaeon]|nr:hypothetical protein [Nanoarchaeota archaeon]MBU1444827.1 hypothetical protein [Nanoarchaeota archaeon]MBU2406438.1 hypothetical protein [Nanoarchaeota archaeon]MBU2419995.1 hypothetical protein [Nanoarchaeota archaeon]MBU2475438.1 hypothetical protein [Nanoarchaeota archaeon]